MRRICFVISIICILAGIGLRPAFCSDAAMASKENVIYSFTGGADGGQPASDLTLDSAGNLYGATAQGGTGTACNSGCGTVFELKHTSDGWKKEVLYSFVGGKDAASPQGGVIFDKGGNLYGVAGGGEFSTGTVYRLHPNSHGGWTETVIYSFNFNCCAYPAGDLVFDASGNIYGTVPGGMNATCISDDGCGGVYKLAPQSDGSWTETTLYAFTDIPDAGTPTSGVALDSMGDVYGLTTYGGTGPCRPDNTYGEVVGCGALYKLSPNRDGSWTETILYDFVRGGGFGVFPSGPLFFDNADHLFGVSQAGGDGLGTVFEFQNTKKNGWQQSEAHIFPGSPDGLIPVGRLVMDADRRLFGVTHGGGGPGNGNGIVYEVAHSKSGWQETILHKFSGSPDGSDPSAGLVSDGQGHFYGTTLQGGTKGSATRCSNNGCGTVYEITP
jgi:hypothetical protein